MALSEPRGWQSLAGAALRAQEGVQIVLHRQGQSLGCWEGLDTDRKMDLGVHGQQCSLCPHPRFHTPIPPPYSRLPSHQNQSTHLLGSPTYTCRFLAALSVARHTFGD